MGTASDVGGTVGGVAGAAGGAALGSALLPGVGTVVGGALGGMAGKYLGGAAGNFLGGSGGNQVTGTVTPQQQQQYLSQVQGPNQADYQIGGLNDYQNTMQGLGNQVPGAQDFVGANAGQTGNQTALQNYFQNVANGSQATAADQMFQNSQAQAGQQLQSGMLAQGGMNPALGMRQMANSQAGVQGQIASKSAAQKFQEQAQGAQLAQAGSQALVQQKMAQMQQNYTEQMQGIQAKKDIAEGIFSSNRQQTSLNVEQAQNRTAYQQFVYGQQMQGAKDQASSNAALIRMMTSGVAQGGAAAWNAYGPKGGAGGSSTPGNVGANGAPLEQQGPGQWGGITSSSGGPSVGDVGNDISTGASDIGSNIG